MGHVVEEFFHRGVVLGTAREVGPLLRIVRVVVEFLRAVVVDDVTLAIRAHREARLVAFTHRSQSGATAL